MHPVGPRGGSAPRVTSNQISVCSEISRASSTSMPRHLTVDSSLECPARHRHALQHARDDRRRRAHPRSSSQARADLGGEAHLGPRRRFGAARARDERRPVGFARMRREHQHARALQPVVAVRTGPCGQLHRVAGRSAGLRHGRGDPPARRGALVRGQGVHGGVLLHGVGGDRGGHERDTTRSSARNGRCRTSLNYRRRTSRLGESRQRHRFRDVLFP